MFFIEELNLSDYNNIYVVGDIHGMFNHLENVLKKINFNKEKDLLICTGDLVDRGTESHLAVDYLEKKWFKSVLGNHDIVFSDMENKYNLHPKYEKETIEIGSNNKLLDKFVNVFSKKLPLIIEVNDGIEKIVITHSGLPIINNYKDFKEILLKEENFFKRSLVNALIWDRINANYILESLYNNYEFYLYDIDDILKKYYKKDFSKISIDNKKKYFDHLFYIKDLKALFCGHNIMFDTDENISSYLNINKNNIENYIKAGNRYNIDTGCFLRIREAYMKNDILPDFTIYHLNTMKCVYSIGS